MILGRIRAILTLLQLMITVSIVIILMYMFKKHNRKIRIFWAKLQMKLMGITLKIEGKLDDSADIMIINHQSVLDIILFEYLHPRDVAWVAKKEIANIPWFGHILKAPDMIIVERESKSSLVKLIKDVKSKLNNKRVISIFPEGTRTDGKKLRKFKAGAKIISEKYNLKVQPIVLVGTKDIFDSQKFLQKGGIIKVVYLPTVQADKSTQWYTQTQNDMSNILQKELNSDI
ncbi:MAG: lysophospholipid acyltransferase family protein [Campylobacterota bacterium]|nr:lysophospholipid acyltransferase family protein [Campylobacterota bacterium]